MDEIRNKLVEEMGIANLPQDKQDDLIAKMTEVILKKMYIATIDSLNDNDKAELERLMETNASPEQIESFTKEKISNYEEMVGGIVKELIASVKAGENN